MKIKIALLTLVAMIVGNQIAAHAEYPNEKKTYHANSQYDFSNPEDRKRAQQALSDSYMRSTVERTISRLERSIQNGAPYKNEAQDALTAMKRLQSAL